MTTVYKCSCCDYINTLECQVVWHINAKCPKATVIKEKPIRRHAKECDFKSTRSVRIFAE
ncbi:hypothetical protein ATCVNEJV2_015L [Acanthocystis turfacea Chlorella virus NE-JV-2]|nr:hypothetical protein ATCVNEJV2_015L [Acanthocystis turfacea Chlorella virus NE-JV-2]